MKRLIALIVTPLLFSACDKKDPNTIVNPGTNKVLLIKIDYLTNEFEGGTELSFAQAGQSFSTSVTDTSASDFGSVKITYDEVGQPIFWGSIVWMGLGERKYPQTLLPASTFQDVLTNDYRVPANGFDNIYQAYMPYQDHMAAWARAQGLVKTRSYLDSNPTQVVKVFLYTPSVGSGDPADWDWYFFLKN